MSLDKIDKNHLDNLLLTLSKNNIDNNKLVESSKQNHVEYGQLKLIASQIDGLRKQAEKIIQKATITTNLLNIKCNFSFVSGNKYHLYKNPDDQLFWSLIGPNEWNNYKEFMGTYLYDYDKCFEKV